MDDKHVIYFISQEELRKPLSSDLKHLLDPRKDEPTAFLEDGRINEECTCLHSALAHRCGHLMREAIRCFNSSTKTPRGTECEEEFKAQALCVRKYGGEKESWHNEPRI
ncbi:unnamed protein product [Cylicocyclus nassatus]|uniref:CHCH domain-containing protein n=1 Tax=Cylicocyclus nassatus TaxID=53992 RepID=A0AA36H3D5_CYLNA|nr:unnamed protein product [Cylicocyclus nassatus]